MHLSRILQLFFEAPDALGGSGELSVSDMVDELGKDDDLPPSDDNEEVDLLAGDKEEKDEKDEKDGKKKDDEEELELEPAELDNIDEVPRKEILKKYPELFKDFPQLQRAYYREQEYAKVFPTLEDAKEAQEKVENFDRISETVLSGDITSVLSSIKDADAKTYNKVVDNYLGTLQKVDQNAYFHVIGNVIKHTVSGMFREGQKSKNEDLQTAALLLNQFIFGSSDYEAPKEFGPHKVDDKEDELSKEKQEFYTEKFNAALDDLTTRSTNVIKSTISKHMDPKDSMTPYVKNVAIDKAVAEVDRLIASDSRFKASLDRLWQKAAEKNFSRSSLEDIERAHLNKAKTLLPEIIRKHRSEALRGLGKRVNDKEEREEPQRRGPVSVGRSAGANNTGKKETSVPKGMKTLDFLMQD